MKISKLAKELKCSPQLLWKARRNGKLNETIEACKERNKRGLRHNTVICKIGDKWFTAQELADIIEGSVSVAFKRIKKYKKGQLSIDEIFEKSIERKYGIQVGTFGLGPRRCISDIPIGSFEKKMLEKEEHEKETFTN